MSFQSTRSDAAAECVKLEGWRSITLRKQHSHVMRSFGPPTRTAARTCLRVLAAGLVHTRLVRQALGAKLLANALEQVRHSSGCHADAVCAHVRDVAGLVQLLCQGHGAASACRDGVTGQGVLFMGKRVSWAGQAAAGLQALGSCKATLHSRSVLH